MNSPVISIILSTYNRADMLGKALEWFGEVQRPVVSKVELLVVDNNSKDGTQQVVEQYRKRTDIPVIYIFEHRQGLSYARNAGIAAATGDLLVFIDDDCFASGDWLVEIEQAFHHNEKLAGAGGRVDLYDERDLPITIRTSAEKTVASAGNLFSLVPGCNMCFRRSVFDRIGVFDERFGAGTKLRSAEDSDYIYRAVRAGLLIEYLPDIRVYHAHGRRTEEDARKLAKGYVLGRGGFYCKHVLSKDKVIARHAYWEFRNLAIGAFTKLKCEPVRLMGYLLLGMLIYGWVSLGAKLRHET